MATPRSRSPSTDERLTLSLSTRYSLGRHLCGDTSFSVFVPYVAPAVPCVCTCNHRLGFVFCARCVFVTFSLHKQHIVESCPLACSPCSRCSWLMSLPAPCYPYRFANMRLQPLLRVARLLACVSVASARHASGQHLANGQHASELPRTSQMRHTSELPRISRGYCGVTGSESDCATSSMGSWSMNNATRCIKRCQGCARCNFISFSPELRDCSWYHKCSLANLPGADGTHGTVQVQRSA